MTGTPDMAWRDQELANPHLHAEKAGKVRGMFTAIAGKYDLNNHLHSLWQDVRWRKFAVKQAQVKPGEVVLDVACGTGDLTQEFAKSPASKVIGIDFTHAMLEVAAQKRGALNPTTASKMSYFEGDAQRLPVADASVDVVSIAWGIRNVTDPAQAMREFARVLRPAGRLVILEFDQPRFAPVRWFNDLYAGKIMPLTATLIAGDKSGAYKYLPKSVSTFMSRDRMLELFAQAGLRDAQSWSLSLGICACYRGYKS
jgi:demethylmenaquinone methyltransferase / 2-methoxy-6-polyprenyl-1,4-benzoquinol methylase